MIKQILKRIPRKPSPKSDADADAAAKSTLLRKLIFCSVTYDFTDPTANLREKDLKRRTLLELADYVNTAATKFSEIILEQSIRMIAANLFRTLPSAAAAAAGGGGGDPADEDVPVEDPAWPHLRIVHEFLLRLVCSPNTGARLAKRYIDHSFALRLLDLLDSEDQREREYVKTTLHRLYSKFMVHRPFIRKTIDDIFYQFIFETEHHNGIAELLELHGSIINGFVLPLKEEHKVFLVRVLLPLHKPKCLPLYYKQLSHCITQFVEKDGKLADTVIRGLLKYWPVTSFWKEVMFIEELEEVLKVTGEAEFQRCMMPLFWRIGRCLSSSHFQVAERALLLWNNDHVQNLITQNRGVILSIILPALERTAKGHWNQAVRSLALAVRKHFLDADQELFEKLLLIFHEDEAKEKVIQERQETTWKKLEALAASNSISSEALLLARVASSLSMTSPSPRAAAVGT